MAVVHHYEWSVTRWFTSPTREALDAAGRGIYRELLDVCYTQGAIPSDHAILARMCRASDEEFAQAWGVIGSHFRRHPKDASALINSHANVFRNDYFRYIREQKSRAAAGGTVTGKRKRNKINDKESAGCSNGLATAENICSQHDTTRHDTIEHDTRPAALPNSSVISGIVNEPPPTAADKDALEWIRKSLENYPNAPPGKPDAQICQRALEATRGASLERIGDVLLRLHRRGARPESWGFFPEVLRRELAGGP